MRLSRSVHLLCCERGGSEESLALRVSVDLAADQYSASIEVRKPRPAQIPAWAHALAAPRLAFEVGAVTTSIALGRTRRRVARHYALVAQGGILRHLGDGRPCSPTVALRTGEHLSIGAQRVTLGPCAVLDLAAALPLAGPDKDWRSDNGLSVRREGSSPYPPHSTAELDAWPTLRMRLSECGALASAFLRAERCGGLVGGSVFAPLDPLRVRHGRRVRITGEDFRIERLCRAQRTSALASIFHAGYSWRERGTGRTLGRASMRLRLDPAELFCLASGACSEERPAWTEDLSGREFGRAPVLALRLRADEFFARYGQTEADDDSRR